MRTWIFAAVIASVALAACQKNAPSPNAVPVEFRLTDAPVDYKHVFIDIQGIEMVVDGEPIVVENVQQGVYDLLALSGGMDTLLASITVEPGRLSQIRLILGENNELVLNDSTRHALQTPSAQQSGLKINVQRELITGEQPVFVLDFDAARSIVETGNGSYILKPVIKCLDESSVKVQGRVSPPVRSFVLFYSGVDTLSTYTGGSGKFVFRSVIPGTYGLAIYPDTASGLSPRIIEGIEVMPNQSVDLGEIGL
ncbi:MAG TPA: DUF4382 domain-containing protein [Luteibaculaceae bacterium]|nr:DUF4382 domain-containing protein [Luteibaculaceae bacterium]